MQRGATISHTQTLCFTFDAGKAFTIVFAGFAFTTTSLPNIMRFPALVAGFVRVLILHKFGIVNLPNFFTSLVAIPARLPIILEQTDFFTSCFPASAAASAVLVMAFGLVFIALGSIVRLGKGIRAKYNALH